MNIIKSYFINLRNLKLVSYFIVFNIINFSSLVSALSFEDKFEQSKYIYKLDSSKVLEPNSDNFPKVVSENLIAQQSSSTNLNLDQAIKNFDKAEELIFKALRDFKKGKRYLRSSTRAFNQGNARILQTKIQSKRANKYFEESQENYIEGLNYLKDALSSYKIFLEKLTKN